MQILAIEFDFIKVEFRNTARRPHYQVIMKAQI